MTLRYAFTNQKGGVGKTTTVVNLASVMADWGHRTLVVDIDPQCNATTSLGLDSRSLDRSIYDVLLGQASPLEAVAGVTVVLNAEPARQRAAHLHSVLSLIDGYDYILIDSPPSLGVLTVNALVACHGVVVPVQCEYLALEGLTQLTHTISLVQRGLNRGLSLRGVVMTMFDRRTTCSLCTPVTGRAGLSGTGAGVATGRWLFGGLGARDGCVGRHATLIGNSAMSKSSRCLFSGKLAARWWADRTGISG